MCESVIDINADLGESSEALANGTDYEIMRYITSASIACGGHAGDEDSMRNTLINAKELNVAVGAHPGYPDRKNFGRIELSLPHHAIEASVRAQIEALLKVARSLLMRLVHVKPHGALYHACSKQAETARAVGQAVLSLDPKLMMYGQAGSPMLDIWDEMGLYCVAEAFADRAYEPEGKLRGRQFPGALLDATAAAAQAVNIATKHLVYDVKGRPLAMEAKTICLHSDSPGAAAIAKEVNRQLRSAGVRMQAVSFALSKQGC